MFYYYYSTIINKIWLYEVSKSLDSGFIYIPHSYTTFSQLGCIWQHGAVFSSCYSGIHDFIQSKV